MSSPDASNAQTFLVRTAGSLVGRGKRTLTVSADGIVLDPGGRFGWSDFGGYHGDVPHTLVHRNGRKLLIAQASSDARAGADVRGCLQAMARAIAAHNAGHSPAEQLGPDVEGERRGARRQRSGMIALSLLALVMTVIAWTVPAPLPVVAKFLPLTIVVIGAVYAAVLHRRVRALDARRAQAPARH